MSGEIEGSRSWVDVHEVVGYFALHVAVYSVHYVCLPTVDQFEIG